MLPRSQSIFQVGEEGGAQYHCGSLVGAAMVGGGGRRVREGLVVGLQILVHHQHGGHHHHGRHAHAHANIVLKQMVRPLRAPAVSCSFLKACSLCRRELSANKDVYMYRHDVLARTGICMRMCRGDQGFCSEECRWQQILVDESREREAVSKERRGVAHHHSPHHTPIRGRPRKTLAVALPAGA